MSRSYWIQHKGFLLVGLLGGFAGVVYAMRMPVHNRGFVLSLLVVSALLRSPFTFRTVGGRLWWTTFLVALGSGIVAVLLGALNPLSWICTIIAACAYSVAVCLRWHPVS